MDRADITVSDWGRAWYWALTAINAVCGVGFFIAAFPTRKPLLKRVCYLSALSCYTLSMGYFAMAADLGWVAVEVEWVRGSKSAVPGRRPTRQIFWVRYVSWAIGTPLLMTQLFLLASASIETILFDAFLVFVVIATGLAGAVIPTAYKWAYYFYGGIAWAGIAYQVACIGLGAASTKGSVAKSGYLRCSSVMMLAWAGYGIAWGVGEAANLITPAEEAVFYGVLDLLAGPTFGVLVALAARRFPVEEARVQA